jgi:CO/xanthine dehydrogenase FAD-binding subunit
MKPCAFEYLAPGSVPEVMDLLQQYGDQAKILAGGQSLVPIMNFRLARPEVLIDINGLKELAYIREEADELMIGALTRERDVELAPLVRQKCPLLSEAISYIGHPTIRNRGTVGGSLAHGDPSAEIPTAIYALDGTIKTLGPDGESTFKPEEFFLTYLTTCLEPSQIVVDVTVPVLPDGTGWSFVELSRRSGDFAIVAVATVLFMDGNGACTDARICLGGVAPTPVRAQAAEDILSGQTLSDALVKEAGRLAVEATDPESDYHASADYRKAMTEVLVRKALRSAWEKTRRGE